MIIGSVNIFLALLLPAVYLWYRKANPVASFYALSLYTCISFKLISYLAVNRAYRLIRKEEKQKEEDNNNDKSELNLNLAKDEAKKLAEFQSKLLKIDLIEYPDNINLKGITKFRILFKFPN
jgi:hypothetical protein